VNATGPAVARPETGGSKRWSVFAILAFLAAVTALMVGLGATIVFLIERGSGSMEMSSYDLHELRVAGVVMALVSLGFGIIGFFLCSSADGHVRESQESLKGRFLARGGFLMSAAPIAFVVFAALPHYERVESETREAEKTVDAFVAAVQEGRFEDARTYLADEAREKSDATRLKADAASAAEYLNQGADGRIGERGWVTRDRVVVASDRDRGMFRYRANDTRGRYNVERRDILIVKERGEWKIRDPFGPVLEERAQWEQSKSTIDGDVPKPGRKR
jgi:hypothetical protein